VTRFNNVGVKCGRLLLMMSGAISQTLKDHFIDDFNQGTQLQLRSLVRSTGNSIVARRDPIPHPSEHEVLVRIEAAPLNDRRTRIMDATQTGNAYADWKDGPAATDRDPASPRAPPWRNCWRRSAAMRSRSGSLRRGWILRLTCQGEPVSAELASQGVLSVTDDTITA